MKALLIGLKEFTGKDGRHWLNFGLVYDDFQAAGGKFASSVMCSGDSVDARSFKPGSEYDFDFDNRGRLLSVHPL